jgi:hypothetical protein
MHTIRILPESLHDVLYAGCRVMADNIQHVYIILLYSSYSTSHYLPDLRQL